jgi:Tn3 transposase DDE domain
LCQAHDEGAGQSEALRFVGVGDIPCQGRPPFPRGIVPNSRKLSGSPECDRNEANARVSDLVISLCAGLMAEACNTGLEPLIRLDHPVLTRDRLGWVLQNYIRADTLIRANARLVDYQATLTLAQAWGGGEVASADGLRFVVPIRTLNAGPNRKYFGASRGVTYYNFTSDQFTGFHGIDAARLTVYLGGAARR